MQKIGTIQLNVSDQLIRGFIVYFTDNLKIVRFEIYESMSDYDVMNTGAAIAAYYKDGKEFQYGNEDLIKKVNHVLTTVSITPGVTERESDFSNGSITFKNIKRCKDGSQQTYTTVNGIVTSESYLLDGNYISFDSIDASSDTVLQPINLLNYEVVGELASIISTDTDGLEYYTEEQLRSIYGTRMDHLYSYDYRVCGSLQEAFEWLDEFRQTKEKLVAVDIESTGLEMDMFGDDCMTSVGLAYNTTSSMMFVFRQKGCSYNLPVWFFSEIVDALDSLPKTTRVGTYNGKMEIESFWKERSDHIKYSSKANAWESDDWHMWLRGAAGAEHYQPNAYEIERANRSPAYKRYKESPETCNKSLTVRSDVDGFHLSMKIDQRRGKGLHTLKTLASKVTGLFWLELEHIFKGKIKFDVLPPNLIKLYAGSDPCNTIRVIKSLEEQLPASMRKVTELEHYLTYVKSENEYYGMRTDVNRLNKTIARYSYMKSVLEKRIREIHRTNKNIRSNAVKQMIFYDQLHAPISIRTVTGAPSTSKEALEDIIASGKLSANEITSDVPDMVMFLDEYGFVTEPPKNEEEKAKKEKFVILSGKELASNRYPSLLMFRKYSAVCKELGALERIKKKSHNGRVTFYIISDGAESDRQTSDAHQYSDEMKKMILSDSDDHWLISCDYTQVELRVLAYLAKEEKLIELERDPKVDIHRAVLSIITGKPIHLISDEERKIGKQTNFGVVYGMSAFGLVKRRYGLKYTKEQLRECFDAIIDFYNGLPGVKRLVADSEEFVLKHHKIITEFGYIREFNQLKDPAISKKAYSRALKGAGNTRIQGFAATMMKIAEVNYYNYIRQKGWDELVDCNGVMLPKVRMQLSIHDEVLISAHKSIPVSEIIEMCKICQELDIKGAPPFFASPAFVENWYAGKSSKYEIPILYRDKIVEMHHKGVEILDMNRYSETLKEYRDTLLKDYMDELITKYKTPEEVTKHVDDPELTHVLIAVSIRDDEKLPHEEKIRLSVERYMEGHKVDDVVYDEKESDSTEEAAYMLDDVDVGKYIYYDENGEQIVEYLDDETQEELESEDDESTLPDAMLEQRLGIQEAYCVYALDACLVDLTTIYRFPCSEDVHRELKKLSFKNPGAYKLMYIVGTKMIDTGLTIGYVSNEIDAIVQNAVINKEVV